MSALAVGRPHASPARGAGLLVDNLALPLAPTLTLASTGPHPPAEDLASDACDEHVALKHDLRHPPEGRIKGARCKMGPQMTGSRAVVKRTQERRRADERIVDLEHAFQTVEKIWGRSEVSG